MNEPEPPWVDAQTHTRPITTMHRTMLLGDRYRLDLRIAVGGMGEIWGATDTVLGRHVAVKVLRADLAELPGFNERFRREARNLAMLSHPAIATLFDYGEQDGSPYLVMELVVGEHLGKHLARHAPMPVEHVVDVVTQIAAGLAVAHQAGMVHRDIKPANVMITDRGRVKITDFGIARLVDSSAQTLTSEVLGTPQYMSPEQISGESVTPASDVYSLGIVTYEMLAGHPPFSGDDPIAVALAQLHEPPATLPPTVPAALATVVGRALAKAPADRPADGGAMIAALGGVDREATSTSPASNTAAELFAPTIAIPPELVVSPTAIMPPLTAAGAIPSSGDSSAALMEPLRRHRTKRRISMALGALAIAALAAVVLLGGHPDRPTALTGDTVLPTSAPVAVLSVGSSSPSVATTLDPPVAATAAPTIVDPAQYVGRDYRAVVAELRALGFVVAERRVDVERGTEKDIVVAVTPSGELASGTAIEVQIADPPKGKKKGGG